MPLDILSKSYLFVKQYWPCWWWLFVDARNFPMPNQIYSDKKQRSIGLLEVQDFMHDVLNIMLNCSTWTSTLLLILGLQLLLNRVKALAFACLPNMWHLLHVTKADSSYWNVTKILPKKHDFYVLSQVMILYHIWRQIRFMPSIF